MPETFTSPVDVQTMHLQNHNDHAIDLYSAPKPSIYSQSLAKYTFPIDNLWPLLLCLTRIQHQNMLHSAPNRPQDAQNVCIDSFA